ncbi:aminoglycoside phosphotransferase family protein [Gymnodinialimonas hymeniacidonis]|uniref:aminoglycoside phosphotransferase family protein n=1 Tax=Gymnodinialimonas hymeniacidonis TaxID=3126508 RepID=UPI0034C5FE09
MIDAFLERHGWGDAARAPLAGDASTRRYTRLQEGDRKAILMEDPDLANLARFQKIGAHLRDLGLSAAQSLAADYEHALLLLEDLGDQTLSRLLAEDIGIAETAYHATADMLPLLANPPPNGLDAPDADGMAAMTGLTFDLLPDSDALRQKIMPALADALARHAAGPPVLSLRDVHADNLIWLPERDGSARIGLLDYQDAMLLPDGYDLASLLDDPRRDLPETWKAALVTDRPRFATLSLQRNLRILGIFHRLATQYGKPHYRTFLPRTATLMERAAQDLPALRVPVAELLERTAHWAAP